MKAWLRLLLMALLGATGSASAFDFSPISQDFEPAGRGATQLFRVENTNAQPIALELTIYAINISFDGTEERTPAEDLFVVYPPQIVLTPEQSQVVRVQWIGPPKPQLELVYRLIVEQLPIELEERQQTGARINVLLRYEALIYIVPRGAKGELRLVSVEPDISQDGKPHLAITLQNRGTAHARAVDPKLTLTAAGPGKRVVLGADQLPGLAGFSVLAGRTRRFMVPWPESLPVGPVAGEIRVDVER